MLAFFDFYPIITRSDSFFELYIEALGWAMWNLWNPFLVLLSILFSRFLARNISLNTLTWTFFLSFVSLFFLGVSEYLIREKFDLLRGTGRLSDQLLFITESVMVLWLMTIPLVVASFVFKKNENFRSPQFIPSRFQSLSKWKQRMLLTLFTTSLFSYPFIHFPLLLVGFFGFGFVWLKNVQSKPNHHRRFWSDLIPIGLIALVMILLSQFNIRAVLQSIPFFNQYFN